MRVEFKAILKSADDVIKKDDLTLQYVLFEKHNYDSSTGEPINVVCYPATVFNSKLTPAAINTFIGKRVNVVCYLNSQESKKDDKVFHNLRLKVHSMQAINDNATKP